MKKLLIFLSILVINLKSEAVTSLIIDNNTTAYLRGMAKLDDNSFFELRLNRGYNRYAMGKNIISFSVTGSFNNCPINYTQENVNKNQYTFFLRNSSGPCGFDFVVS